MSADRFEITDTNGLRDAGKPCEFLIERQDGKGSGDAVG